MVEHDRIQDPIQATDSSPITDYADPRQGTILNPDSDPLGVDPRKGTILYPDSDPLAVDPRQGTVVN